MAPAAIVEKYGSLMSATMTPTMSVSPRAIARAFAFGV
jgi:hypothetical protein